MAPGELRLPSYGLFSCTEVLGQLALEKMLAGLSSRRYVRGLEPAGHAVEDAAVSVSKSAVSRRFVAATETALAELMSRRLEDLDLVAFMADGVHFGEHTCVVALGIGIDGTKNPLAVEEGSTENATLVTDLITGLRDRGLDVTKPILAVLDGAKALSRAVKDVSGKPLIHRCQEHKIRNVKDKLPEKLRAVTERQMRQAYHAESALKAEGLLTALAAELAKTHPGAAASLREGMAETLTILRLGVPPTLARTLRSTNTIVISSRPVGVLHVRHECVRSRDLRGGGGYLPLVHHVDHVGGAMHVQRVAMPASRAESWTVLGDDDVPVEPVERFLAYLTDIERSPNTVKAYAHDLKDYWVFLAHRGLDWREVRLEDIGEFVAWLRVPPAGRAGAVAVLPSVGAACRRGDDQPEAGGAGRVLRSIRRGMAWMSGSC